MWFSYQGEEDWIPLYAGRVREIKEMNKKGQKPADLNEEAVELEPVTPTKVLDYENVVGQDSLTRLDERNRRNRNKNRRNNRNKSGAEAQKSQQQAQPSGDGQANNNARRNNNRRRGNRNNNRPKAE